MSEKKFEWLNEEICKEYLARAKELPKDDGQDTGPWRDLRIELQERCNLTEVQAYNIIHGYHVKEYLQIYGILSGRIPMPEAMRKKLEKDKKKHNVDELIRSYEERIADLESLQKGGYASGSDYGFEEKDD